MTIYKLQIHVVKIYAILNKITTSLDKRYTRHIYMYYYHLVHTSDAGLCVTGGIIHPVVSA